MRLVTTHKLELSRQELLDKFNVPHSARIMNSQTMTGSAVVGTTFWFEWSVETDLNDVGGAVGSLYFRGGIGT